MDATTIVLPATPVPPQRPGLPVLAAVVPVIAGIVLWLITGSLFTLCFAALGPLMLVASFFDGMRSRRREQRRRVTDADDAWERAEAERRRLHDEEHAALWRRHPDVAACLAEPPLRGHDSVDRTTSIVVARGDRPSRIRASGGDDERARAFRDRTATLPDAPIAVPLGGGVCVRGEGPVPAAIARALIAQLCLRFGPTQLSLGGELETVGVAGFPHVARRRAGFQLGVVSGAACDERADAKICLCAPGAEPPDGVTTVIDAADGVRARVRTPDGVTEATVEALSLRQTALIASDCGQRSAGESFVPDAVALAALSPAPRAGGLPAMVGRGERGDVLLDLVEDGPHAIVTGMTGTGKSELLTTWVTAMAAARTPAEVGFVLVDFKGGTAFDPLRSLPHVLAVATDLDADGARRGVTSLTAELRRREAALAAAGVRDVRDCAELGRLVIVVDEFAALLQEHPDLGSVFTDVAARGRALGMHLVLGTQRASGVIRDALAANCPLRISLRVSDPADSRLVIGSDAASELAGGPESRGLAFMRRPGDTEALPVRVALTAETDLRSIAERSAHVAAPPSPWLPPLPRMLLLHEIPGAAPGLTLGLGDDPAHQRQQPVRLAPARGLAVLGGPAAGKSAVIRLLASQDPGAVVVPADLEGAWDAVTELSRGRHGLVLCDDLDLLLTGFPPEYAQVFTSRWEAIARSEGGAVITLSRAAGSLGRLIDALPHRALLRMPSRIEHLAAGGESSDYERDRPAGRAQFDGMEMQFCWTDEPGSVRRASAPPVWRPRAETSGVITPAVIDTVERLRSTHPEHRVVEIEQAADAAGPRIIVADPEQWRSQWTLTQLVRTSGEMVVAAECAGELRQLAGVRDLPPYAHQHAGRGWVTAQGAPPRRVLIADQDIGW
ncbi:FtsK/SpoIIIE domain-containing protein [Microbacterium istanbulense]|uniref:FtsK/SpoIIIE domain-containing protein n=1 Tax=Microbacterium istanbulense TaxID=3122049 RepID=A0ABU8LLM3_9MICO